MKKAIALILLFILVLTLNPLTVFADEDIKVTYTTNFSNDLDREGWNRLEVEIENQSNSDFTGRVEVDASGRYIQEIFIEKGKKISVEFYLPPLGVENISQVDVAVKNKNNRTVSSRRLNIGYYGSVQNQYIGIVSNNPERFRRIQNFNQVETVALKEEHFNNHLFMGNISTIIIDSIDRLSLNAAQKENLELWIKRGGILVIGGGRTASENIGIINSDIRPYTVGNNVERELDIEFFEGSSNVLFTSGEVLGNIDLGTGDFPLLVSKDVSKGRVLFSTINFNDGIFDNVADFEKYLEAIIVKNPSSYQRSMYRVRETERLLSIMSVDLGGLKFLSPWFLITGLMAYILLVGPFNFAILKKFRKMDYGWITIPALSVVFTIVLFLVGSTGRSKDMTNTQMNIIEYLNQDSAHVESYNSWFIPSGRNREIQANFLSFTPTTSGLTYKNNTVFDTAEARVWSNQRAIIGTTEEITGPTVKLELYANEIVANITNNYDYELFQGYFRIGERWYKVGELAPGESKEFKLRNNNSNHVDYQGLFQRLGINTHMYSNVIENIAMNNGNYIFIAFDDAFVPVKFQNTPTSQVLNISVIGEHSMEIDIKETGAVKDISPAITKISFQHFDRWDSSYYYFVGSGEIEFVFDLPKGVVYEGFTGRLTANFYRGRDTDIQVYNNETNKWEEYQVNSSGGIVDLQNIEKYISNNQILMKITSDDDNDHIEFNHSAVTFSIVGGGN